MHVNEVDMYLTRLILRYVSTEDAVSHGKITAYPNSRRGMSDDAVANDGPRLSLIFLF